MIGTRATIASGAYEHAIHAIDRKAKVFSEACPLLVPLIEEGISTINHRPVIDRYLAPLFAEDIDTLVLGCTHYPLAREAIARAAGDAIDLVDSAENCALAVKALRRSGPCRAGRASGKLDVALTDSTENFLHS